MCGWVVRRYTYAWNDISSLMHTTIMADLHLRLRYSLKMSSLRGSDLDGCLHIILMKSKKEEEKNTKHEKHGNAHTHTLPAIRNPFGSETKKTGKAKTITWQWAESLAVWLTVVIGDCPTSMSINRMKTSPCSIHVHDCDFGGHRHCHHPGPS